jgi:hypothetical protein
LPFHTENTIIKPDTLIRPFEQLGAAMDPHTFDMLKEIPDDILLDILDQCRPQPTLEVPVLPTALAFSQVCQRWRQLSLNTPALWTVPIYQWSAAGYMAAKIMMQRAQSRSLSVVWKLDPLSNAISSPSLPFRPSEIRSISVGAPGWILAHLVSQLLRSGLPQLEHIHLVAEPKYEDGEVQLCADIDMGLNPRGWENSRLRVVHLEQCRLTPFTTLAWSAVTHLTMDLSKVPDVLTQEEFFDIMASASSLHNLRLTGLLDGETFIEHIRPDFHITSPQLTDIYIDDPLPLCLTLLEDLDLGSCVRIKLRNQALLPSDLNDYLRRIVALPCIRVCPLARSLYWNVKEHNTQINVLFCQSDNGPRELALEWTIDHTDETGTGTETMPSPTQELQQQRPVTDLLQRLASFLPLNRLQNLVLDRARDGDTLQNEMDIHGIRMLLQVCGATLQNLTLDGFCIPQGLYALHGMAQSVSALLPQLQALTLRGAHMDAFAQLSRQVQAGGGIASADDGADWKTSSGVVQNFKCWVQLRLEAGHTLNALYLSDVNEDIVKPENILEQVKALVGNGVSSIIVNA